MLPNIAGWPIRYLMHAPLLVTVLGEPIAKATGQQAGGGGGRLIPVRVMVRAPSDLQHPGLLVLKQLVPQLAGRCAGPWSQTLGLGTCGVSEICDESLEQNIDIGMRSELLRERSERKKRIPCLLEWVELHSSTQAAQVPATTVCSAEIVTA